ncbi:hypothetical protein TNCV_2144691 [Trichonephila clavipes]|nr:hypothetical protein TNCV_2144691 [Trichonephila clavipes]
MAESGGLSCGVPNDESSVNLLTKGYCSASQIFNICDLIFKQNFHRPLPYHVNSTILYFDAKATIPLMCHWRIYTSRSTKMLIVMGVYIRRSEVRFFRRTAILEVILNALDYNKRNSTEFAMDLLISEHVLIHSFSSPSFNASNEPHSTST